jgi:hypothetical protein
MQVVVWLDWTFYFSFVCKQEGKGSVIGSGIVEADTQ